jgi:predicted nuclease with RNAse H fold
VLGGGLWPRDVRWDRRYQQLRGLKLARHLKAKGIEVLEVEHPKRRWLAVTKLSAEIAELDAQLDRLVRQVAPELVSLAGIGTDHAATLLIVALKTIP